MPEPTLLGDGFDQLDLGWLRAKPGEKWAEARRAGDDVLACWVADMDFPAPPPVLASLERLSASSDLGYPALDEEASLGPVWEERAFSRYGWSPSTGRVRAFSDIVQAVQAVLHVATEPGDGVLLFAPAYPPFVWGMGEMGRRLLPVPAVDGGGRWVFDLAAAEQAAPGATALLLVNPHNPTGRMLGADELEAVAALAERHDLLVIADEVHADLVLVDSRHIPFASLGPEVEARTVTLCSASKSHNLGGLRCAIAHVGHEGAARGLAALPPRLLGRVSVPAVTATLAAWSGEGDRWLDRAVARLRDNRMVLGRWLGAGGARAGVRGYLPEATYLWWMDFGATVLAGEEDPAPELARRGRVLLSGGPRFGPGGRGFARLNFATSPRVLEEILGRIEQALTPP